MEDGADSSGTQQPPSSLFSLPLEVWLHILAPHKCSLQMRMLRLVSKGLRRAVDCKVKSLVVDSPFVNPFLFPFLSSITLVVWSPDMKPTDLHLLLPYLLTSTSVRSLHITVARSGTLDGVHHAYQQPHQPLQQNGLLQWSARFESWVRGVFARDGMLSAERGSLRAHPQQGAPSLAPGTFGALLDLLSKCYKIRGASSLICSRGSAAAELGPQPVLKIDVYLHPSVLRCVQGLSSQLTRRDRPPATADNCLKSHPEVKTAAGVGVVLDELQRRVLLHCQPSLAVDSAPSLQHLCKELHALEPELKELRLELPVAVVRSGVASSALEENNCNADWSGIGGTDAQRPLLTFLSEALNPSYTRPQSSVRCSPPDPPHPNDPHLFTQSQPSLIQQGAQAHSHAASRSITLGAEHACGSATSSSMEPAASLSQQPSFSAVTSSSSGAVAELGYQWGHLSGAHSRACSDHQKGSKEGLKRLDLSFKAAAPSGAPPFPLGSGSGLPSLARVLAPSLRHLTLKGDSAGLIQLPLQGMSAIAELKGLQTLTVWLKEFLDEEDLRPLSALPHLQHLQVARIRVSVEAPALLPVCLPQVSTLSFYLSEVTHPFHAVPLSHHGSSTPPLLRIFPNAHTFTLRDFPLQSDLSVLAPAPSPVSSTEDATADAAAAITLRGSHPHRPQHYHASPPSPSLDPQPHSLILLQHTPLQSLHPRAVSQMDALGRMTSLRTITFKHFTSLLHVRELCDVIAKHLPNLTALHLVASSEGCKVPRLWQPGMFLGLVQLRVLSIDVPKGCHWNPLKELLVLADVPLPQLHPRGTDRSGSSHNATPHPHISSIQTSTPSPSRSQTVPTSQHAALTSPPSQTASTSQNATPSPTFVPAPHEAAPVVTEPSTFLCSLLPLSFDCIFGFLRGVRVHPVETTHHEHQQQPQPPQQQQHQQQQHRQGSFGARLRRRTTSILGPFSPCSSPSAAVPAVPEGNCPREPQGLENLEVLQLLGCPLPDEDTALQLLQKLPRLQCLEVTQGCMHARGSKPKDSPPHGCTSEGLIALPRCLNRDVEVVVLAS